MISYVTREIDEETTDVQLGEKKTQQSKETHFRVYERVVWKGKRNVLCCSKNENQNKWADVRANQIFTRWKEFPKRQRCPELKGAAPEKISESSFTGGVPGAG